MHVFSVPCIIHCFFLTENVKSETLKSVTRPSSYEECCKLLFDHPGKNIYIINNKEKDRS